MMIWGRPPGRAGGRAGSWVWECGGFQRAPTAPPSCDERRESGHGRAWRSAMKGTHESDGTVTITWNSQNEVLHAPDAIDHRCIYLPCEGCGAVRRVKPNVVAVWCDTCQLHNADPDGQHPNCHQCQRAQPGLGVLQATAIIAGTIILGFAYRGMIA